MYNFRKCREEKGYTQQYIALCLNVKAPSVNEWENGRSNPTIRNLIALAKLLEVSVDKLLGIDENNSIKVINDDNMTQDEAVLLADYRKLNDQGKQFIKQAMAGALSIYKKPVDLSNMESKKIG